MNDGFIRHWERYEHIQRRIMLPRSYYLDRENVWLGSDFCHVANLYSNSNQARYLDPCIC